LEEDVDEMAAARFATLFFESFLAAEFDARATFCFGSIQAGALKIVNPELDVSAKLLL
jgi:hypothetical protein